MVRNIFIVLFLLISFKTIKAANNVVITTAKDTVCPGVQFSLKGSVNSDTVKSWHWSYSYNGNTFLLDSSQNINTLFLGSGSYTVTLTVILTSGIIDSQKTTIFVVQPPIVNFATTTLTQGIPQVVTFSNTSSNAPEGYVWSFGDNSTLVQLSSTTASHIYGASGVYTVTLFAYGVNGCMESASIPIVINDTSGLTMPNVFTPNADGINDYFAPNAHGLKTLSCNIYDRWGIKIITLDNTNVSYWDGYTTSGIACVEGTYFYTLSATDLNNKSYSLKGYFLLIR